MKLARQGGASIQSKTGHVFIKERMRQECDIYGGEMTPITIFVILLTGTRT